MKLIKIKGSYKDVGKIELESMRIVEWNELSNKTIPKIPIGSNLELSITIDENDFLSGKGGIVWATFDLRQAEIIQNSLLAQNINSEIIEIGLVQNEIYLMDVNNYPDIKDAIEFIWKGDSGLCLKPDWNYKNGESNKSFELWLSGH